MKRQWYLSPESVASEAFFSQAAANCRHSVTHDDGSPGMTRLTKRQLGSTPNEPPSRYSRTGPLRQRFPQVHRSGAPGLADTVGFTSEIGSPGWVATRLAERPRLPVGFDPWWPFLNLAVAEFAEPTEPHLHYV